MKKNSFILVLASLVIMLSSISFAATCEHDAQYAKNIKKYYSDNDYHVTVWNCTKCGQNVNNKFKHTYVDGECECGYCTHPASEATRIYKQYIDDTYHMTTWTCSTCNKVVSEKFKHTEEDGKCGCGYCYHPEEDAKNIYKQYENDKYHTTTWTCGLCGIIQSDRYKHTLESNKCECGYYEGYIGNYYNNYYPYYNSYCNGYYNNCYNSNNNNYYQYYNNGYYYNNNCYYNNYPYSQGYYNNQYNYNYQPTIANYKEIKDGRCYAVANDGSLYKRTLNSNQAIGYIDNFVETKVKLTNAIGKVLILNGDALYDINGVYVSNLSTILE